MNEVFSKQDRRRLFYVLLPKSTGKSTLCNTINTCVNDKGKLHICIDLDSYTSAMLCDMVSSRRLSMFKENANLSDTVLHPIIKEQLLKLLKDYKMYNILAFSSSTTLIPFLGIKLKRLHVYVPSPSLWTTVLSNIKSGDTTQVLEESKHAIMQSYGPQTTTYNDFDDLQSHLITAFNLKKNTTAK